LSDSELIDIKTYSNIDEAQLYPNDVIKLSLSDKDIRCFPGKFLEFKNLHRLSLDGSGQLIIDEGILMYSKLQWIKISGYEPPLVRICNPSWAAVAPLARICNPCGCRKELVAKSQVVTS
jgi:hypothetical protein